jgi:hypothetical protein
MAATLFNFYQNEKENVMKALRASILVLALFVCAYAGNMQNEFAAPPPPPPPSTPEAVMGDLATEIALNLLQSVLSLF